jgi:hypothetical protein
VVIVAFVFTGSDDTVPYTPTAPSGSQQAAEPERPVSPDAKPGKKDPIGDLIESLPEGAQGNHAGQAADGPAWKRFASVAPDAGGKPVIAVVIDDVGLNRARTDDVIALPAAVTLAFLPYGDDTQGLVDRARQAGHEVMLHLPMQPESAGQDPGPDALVTGLPAEELQRRIASNMDGFHGYVGFNNHMGSRFTADQEGMDAVMQEAHRRGLMFLDSRTTAKTRGAAEAARYGVPALERDVFIDNVMSEQAVRAQLDKAVVMAREKGHAIVIGHPHPSTVAALKAWIPALNDVTLVPITALLGQEQRRPALAAQ